MRNVLLHFKRVIFNVLYVLLLSFRAGYKPPRLYQKDDIADE